MIAPKRNKYMVKNFYDCPQICMLHAKEHHSILCPLLDQLRIVFEHCLRGLFNYSVKPSPDLSRLGLWSTKTRFGQVGNQVGQVKDQVDQGHGLRLSIWTFGLTID